MKSKLKFTLLLLIVFLIGACKKESDPENTLPTNATESFGLVTKKWDFPSSAVYSSIELTKDTMYVIEKATQQKSTDPEIISGKFSISKDGKTITFIGFGKMIIKSMTSNSINIEICLDNSPINTPLSGTQSADEPNVIAGTTWITGTLNDSIDGSVEAKRKFYLKVKFITSAYMEVWDCYYDGSTKLNTKGAYFYDELKGLINENIFTISPMQGITRVYKKLGNTTNTPGTIVGTEWRTGTLIEKKDGIYVKYYLKMTITSDTVKVWDCYYNGTININNSFAYVLNGNKIQLQNGSTIANIEQRAIIAEPMPGIIRIFAKQ